MHQMEMKCELQNNFKNFNFQIFRWSTLLPKPLFSSPSSSDTGVLVGCVDNQMYFLSHRNGSVVSYFLLYK